MKKNPFQFWREIWILVVVNLLQLYLTSSWLFWRGRTQGLTTRDNFSGSFGNIIFYHQINCIINNWYLHSATILLNGPKGRLYFYLLMDSVCRYFAMQKKASRKYCKIKSHQSGPGNGRFGFSTSDTRQSDIVSFVCFIQAVAWSFCNAWRICKRKTR